MKEKNETVNCSVSGSWPNKAIWSGLWCDSSVKKAESSGWNHQSLCFTIHDYLFSFSNSSSHSASLQCARDTNSVPAHKWLGFENHCKF